MEMISAKDASLELGVSLRRVQQLISSGRLPATQIGGSWIINKPDLALVSDRKAGRPKKEGAAAVATTTTGVKPTKKGTRK
jgi:excisionase family DNA binding protein